MKLGSFNIGDVTSPVHKFAPVHVGQSSLLLPSRATAAQLACPAAAPLTRRAAGLLCRRAARSSSLHRSLHCPAPRAPPAGISAGACCPASSCPPVGRWVCRPQQPRDNRICLERDVGGAERCGKASEIEIVSGYD